MTGQARVYASTEAHLRIECIPKEHKLQLSKTERAGKSVVLCNPGPTFPASRSCYARRSEKLYLVSKAARGSWW